MMPEFNEVILKIKKNFSLCFYNSIGIYGTIFAFEVNLYLAA